MQRTTCFILLGTGQSQETQRDTLPRLISDCAVSPTFVPRFFDGVGTGMQRRTSRFGWRILTGLSKGVDLLTAFTMKQRILDIWKATESDDKYIFIGSSRGAFSAQTLVQIVGDHGYAHQQGDVKATEKRIQRGEAPQPKREAKVSALYALDPVATRLTLTSGRFMGFQTKTFTGVDRARVVLMRSEERWLFRPNIYDYEGNGNNPPYLTQLWFDGVHADAWGPSQLAIPVLAHILSDLDLISVNVDFGKLFDRLQTWTSAPRSKGDTPQHLGWLGHIRRSTPDHTQFHKSASGMHVGRVHLYLVGEEELGSELSLVTQLPPGNPDAKRIHHIIQRLGNGRFQSRVNDAIIQIIMKVVSQDRDTCFYGLEQIAQHPPFSDTTREAVTRVIKDLRSKYGCVCKPLSIFGSILSFNEIREVVAELADDSNRTGNRGCRQQRRHSPRDLPRDSHLTDEGHCCPPLCLFYLANKVPTLFTERVIMKIVRNTAFILELARKIPALFTEDVIKAIAPYMDGRGLRKALSPLWNHGVSRQTIIAVHQEDSLGLVDSFHLVQFLAENKYEFGHDDLEKYFDLALQGSYYDILEDLAHNNAWFGKKFWTQVIPIKANDISAGEQRKIEELKNLVSEFARSDSQAEGLFTTLLKNGVYDAVTQCLEALHSKLDGESCQWVVSELSDFRGHGENYRRTCLKGIKMFSLPRDQLSQYLVISLEDIVKEGNKYDITDVALAQELLGLGNQTV